MFRCRVKGVAEVRKCLVRWDRTREMNREGWIVGMRSRLVFSVRNFFKIVLKGCGSRRFIWDEMFYVDIYFWWLFWLFCLYWGFCFWFLSGYGYWKDRWRIWIQWWAPSDGGWFLFSFWISKMSFEENLVEVIGFRWKSWYRVWAKKMI